VVAFAGGRQRLASGTQNIRGLRLLDDNFYGVPQAIAVQLDRADRLQMVNAALDELRASGFLADSVARSGVEGLTVAPGDMQKR
jgi:polar amino acid transport system substrate-binding protein